MMDIEDRLKSLGGIGKDKIPSSADCLQVFEKLPDYYEGLLKDRERQEVKAHLIKCLWCFNSYMEYSITLAQAEAGTLPPAPKWVEDIGMEVFNRFSLLNKILTLHTIHKFLKLKVFSRLRATKGEEEPKKEYYVGEFLEIELSALKDGYITVLHWDSAGKPQLILPDMHDKDTHLKEGETRKISLKAMPPTGKAGFKAFFTKDRLIEPEGIDYKNEEAINRVINDFLEKIKTLPQEDLAEETQEYVVVEK